MTISKGGHDGNCDAVSNGIKMEENVNQTVVAAEENSNIIMYRRRLDRSPSGDFERLTKDQRILISTLRTALEEAKKRSNKLKEENETK